MEDGTSLTLASILMLLTLLALGWLIGQILPWKRSKRPVDLVSSDGGMDYVVRDLNYTVKSDSGNRTKVELRGHIHDHDLGFGILYVSAETISPSPVADEMHRIHNAGAMLCSLRPAEERGKHTDNSGDRPPITLEPPKKD